MYTYLLTHDQHSIAYRQTVATAIVKLLLHAIIIVLLYRVHDCVHESVLLHLIVIGVRT